MESGGVLVDTKLLAILAGEFKTRAAVVETAAYECHGGVKFNLASPAQLRRILFEELQLQVVAKTSAGTPSTGESVLQTLESTQAHPLPGLILQHRALVKLTSVAHSLQAAPHPQT
jgi:DNA polymerase-1